MCEAEPRVYLAEVHRAVLPAAIAAVAATLAVFAVVEVSGGRLRRRQQTCRATKTTESDSTSAAAVCKHTAVLVTHVTSPPPVPRSGAEA